MCFLHKNIIYTNIYVGTFYQNMPCKRLNCSGIAKQMILSDS